MDKFDAILGNDVIEVKAEFTDNLNGRVHDRLASYLCEDIDDLLVATDAAIFGGAVRDSIAGLEIHDIDILARPVSARTICDRLMKWNFVKLRAANVGIMSLYTNIKVIHEPWTFVKSNTIVQVIRPTIPIYSDVNRYGIDKMLHDRFTMLLSNVDISACGVAYVVQPPGRLGAVHETVKSAIYDCKHKLFTVLKDTAMHQKDRITNRIAKLLDRGWTEVTQQTVKIEGIF